MDAESYFELILSSRKPSNMHKALNNFIFHMNLKVCIFFQCWLFLGLFYVCWLRLVEATIPMHNFSWAVECDSFLLGSPYFYTFFM